MNIARLHTESSLWVKLGIAIGQVVFAVLVRMLPHPANFAPMAAVAIFGGAILPRRWALVTPLVAMIASDIVIGLHPLVLYTWGSFAVIALACSHLSPRISAKRVAATSIAASVFFFVVTNFGVWTQGQMYPMTTGGLIQCYVNAIPFFRGTLFGDLFYSGVLFGLYALATVKMPLPRTLHTTAK